MMRIQSAFSAMIGGAVLAVAVAGVGSASPPSAAPEGAPFPPATVARLDAAIAKWLTASKAPGAVVGLWFPGRGNYVVARGYGNASTKTPMSVSDHFRIGSITKTFTVTALLILADKKKVKLDDPVSKYVAGVPNGGVITLRMLANMTSGLFSYTFDEGFVKKLVGDPTAAWTPQQLLNVAFGHKPAFDPATSWQYCNTNTVLLGVIIQKVMKQPIQDVFRQLIFEPLGLKQTSWPTNGAMPAPFAWGITEQTPDGSRADATKWNPSWGFTAGQLISDLSDLRIWVKSYTTGTLVSQAMQKERLTWVTLPPNTPARRYGMGIGQDHGWLGHTGELPGYNTAGFYLPSMGATIVIEVNSDVPIGKDNPAPMLFRAITKILTPDNVPDPPPAAASDI
jgi:D-alanyl-D-alanine carboxypeptidase